MDNGEGALRGDLSSLTGVWGDGGVEEEEV